MIVQIQNRQRKFSITGFSRWIEKSIQKTLENEKIHEYLEKYRIVPVFSITFVGNRQIRRLNQEYRNIDRATDVLSFPLLSNEGKVITRVDKNELFINEQGMKELNFGDIVLSLEKADEQATLFQQSIEREISFLTVHSVLHLLGYDHMDPAEEKNMIRKQHKIMKQLMEIEKETL
jgi:probable rRNA maturation factor